MQSLSKPITPVMSRRGELEEKVGMLNPPSSLVEALRLTPQQRAILVKKYGLDKGLDAEVIVNALLKLLTESGFAMNQFDSFCLTHENIIYTNNCWDIPKTIKSLLGKTKAPIVFFVLPVRGGAHSVAVLIHAPTEKVYCLDSYPALPDAKKLLSATIAQELKGYELVMPEKMVFQQDRNENTCGIYTVVNVMSLVLGIMNKCFGVLVDIDGYELNLLSRVADMKTQPLERRNQVELEVLTVMVAIANYGIEAVSQVLRSNVSSKALNNHGVFAAVGKFSCNVLNNFCQTALSCLPFKL